MTIPDGSDRIAGREYCGHILQGNYSTRLKRRVAEYIACYRAFEKTGNPAMPYVSAWRKQTKTIWYEFVSKRFTGLLGCKPSEVAEVFRDRILDRRIYKYVDTDTDIQKEVFGRKELNGVRKKLREDGWKRGIIDAIYKVSIRENRVIWLKDLATLETFEQDEIYLSQGCLTVVSKEMKAEEEGLQRERLQVLLETAGAVCHELNQPIQGISSYSETMLINLSDGDPLYGKVKKIIELVQRMGNITNKLMKITKYETKDYVEGIKIIDIDKSSRKDI